MNEHNLNNIPKELLVMVGACEKCGKKIIRPYPCDSGVCLCESETLVPLEPHVKIILRMRNGRKLREIISRSKISITVLPKREREDK